MPNKKNVNFKIDYNKDTTYELLGDRYKLKHILTNLVDTSAKRIEKGHVTIGFEKGNDNLTMNVTDTEIGIDEKHHSRLFERFYRVDRHRS